MSKTSLQKAVAIAGGQLHLANAIGVAQARVWKWLNTTENGVSPDLVIAVSAATNWQVTPHELRPDIYPNPNDGLPEHMRHAA